jgi:hypothetical protein
METEVVNNSWFGYSAENGFGSIYNNLNKI